MKLEFELDASQQTIKRIDSNGPVSDSVRFLEAEFVVSNVDSSYMMNPIFARFGSSFMPLSEKTIEGEAVKVNCVVPYSLISFNNINRTEFTIECTLFCTSPDLNTRVTFPSVSVPIIKSGYSDNGVIPSPEHEPSVYEAMLMILSKIKGGEAGKKLSKKTEEDYDFEWVEIDTGSAVWGKITGNIDNQTDLKNAFNLKADKTYVDSKNSELLSKINLKSDITYVDSKVRTLQTQVNLKADKSAVDEGFATLTSEVNKRAEKVYVDFQDSYLQGQLDKKADKTYVDNADSALNAGKQNKNDPTLQTTDKSVVGAINELKDSKQNMLENTGDTFKLVKVVNGVVTYASQDIASTTDTKNYLELPIN